MISSFKQDHKLKLCSKTIHIIVIQCSNRRKFIQVTFKGTWGTISLDEIRLWTILGISLPTTLLLEFRLFRTIQNYFTSQLTIENGNEPDNRSLSIVPYLKHKQGHLPVSFQHSVTFSFFILTSTILNPFKCIKLTECNEYLIKSYIVLKYEEMAL